jgi:hypothetical protein
MRTRRCTLSAIAAVVFAASSSLHCASSEPSSTVSAASDGPPVVAEWVPVATYLGSDTATGDQIFQMLRDHGIASVAYGSLGYTVSVAAPDAEAAREILRAAIAAHTLAPTASVVEARDLPRR